MPDKVSRPMSPGEEAAGLRQAIATTEKELARLTGQLEDPQSDYHKAQKTFQELDGEVLKKHEQVRKLRDGGKKSEADKLDKEIAPLEKERKTAEERLVLEGKERALVQEKVDSLKQKLQKDQKALAALKGKPGKGGPKPPGDKPADKGVEKPKDPKEPEEKPKIPESKEVADAKEQARQKDEQARRADVKARSLSERVQLLRKNIDLEQGLIRMAREKSDRARKAREGFEKDLGRLTGEGTAADKLQEVRQKIAEEARHEDEARQEAQTATQRLTQLRAELTTLQAEQILALAEAERKRREAEEAKEKVAALQNPFTWRNLSQWFLFHGPKLALILLGLVVLQRLVVFSSRRIAGLVARTTTRRRRSDDADHRPETLAAVFRQALTFLLICGATLMILDEVGLSITTLLGSVAVVGLAVSFAAQNLIKDYFYGFLVLLEDQYGVNDFIRVSDVSGTVERITLRVTILRDLDGVAHFVPHGSITTVSNLTHGWSRAMLEVQVAYKEDVDRVIGLLRDLAGEMRRDPYFGLAILDEPQMLGVDALGDSGVTIKFFLKTKPARHLEVKRELLRRVKKEFDRLGIEIPFPHRTLYLRHEDAPHSGVEGNGQSKEAGKSASLPSTP